MLSEKTIAVIGVGKLGEALISGLIRNTAIRKENITGSAAHPESCGASSNRLGITVSTNNKQTVRGKDIVILAVKPQKLENILSAIRDDLTERQLIISAAAAVSIESIHRITGRKSPVIRAMPNILCRIHEGMTVLSKSNGMSDEHCRFAEEIFASLGKTIFLDESLINGVTGLSACGPAYLSVVIEALSDAGVKLGIPREVSTLLAAQTMLGTARMIIETREHPALLRDMVTTPAGCTIDGLLELEDGKLRGTLIRAVVRSAERARELS